MLDLKQKQKLTIFLFITHEMLANVIHHIYKKIDSLLAKVPADFNKDFKYSFVEEFSKIKLKAFIGPFFYSGLYKLNTIGIQKPFSDSYGQPMFSAVMSQIVLHLFYTVFPLMMKVPLLKDGKRIGLLQFLSGGACWS